MKRTQKEIQRVELTNLIHSENRRRGWNLAQLAEHLGISHVYMCSLSSGARRISGLNIDLQRKLARYLGLSLVDLLIQCGSLTDADLRV